MSQAPVSTSDRASRIPRITPADFRLGLAYIVVHVGASLASGAARAPASEETIVWHSTTGLVIALLLLRGARMVWAIAVAILIVLTIRSLPLPPSPRALLPVLVMTVVGIGVAKVLQRAGRFDPGQPLRIRFLTALALGVPAVYLGFFWLLSPAGTTPNLIQAWLAQTAAALAILPFAVVFADRLPRSLGGVLWQPRRDPGDRIDPWVWLLVAVAMALLSIADVHVVMAEVRTSYLMLIPVAWMALHYGLRGAVGTVLIGNVVYLIAMTTVAATGDAFEYQVFLLGGNLAGLLIGALAEAKGRTHRLYQLVTENSTDVISVVRFDGTCEYVSPSTTNVFGVDPETATGTRIQDWVHPDDLDRAARELARAFEGEAQRPSIYRVRAADGTYRWVERTGRLVKNSDDRRSWRLVALVRDISDRHRLEESLRQAQKLESVGRLAGGIAHDFNNLLTAMLGHTSLLEEDDRLPADVKTQVAEIRRASERAAALTSQLLAFARRKVSTPRVVDLNRLIEDMKPLLCRVVGEEVAVATDLAPDLWRVRIDPIQMEQVLLNLAVNARDAMAAGGELTITTTRHTASRQPHYDPAADSGDHVEVTVADTGAGMAADVLARIFEPFFTTKMVGRGSGLGLSVCHGIVRQAGGRIDVESKPGEGTLFRIRLPVAVDDPPDPLEGVFTTDPAGFPMGKASLR